MLRTLRLPLMWYLTEGWSLSIPEAFALKASVCLSERGLSLSVLAENMASPILCPLFTELLMFLSVRWGPLKRRGLGKRGKIMTNIKILLEKKNALVYLGVVLSSPDFVLSSLNFTRVLWKRHTDVEVVSWLLQYLFFMAWPLDFGSFIIMCPQVYLHKFVLYEVQFMYSPEKCNIFSHSAFKYSFCSYFSLLCTELY